MPRQTTQMIKSIENFVEAVRTDSTSWNPKAAMGGVPPIGLSHGPRDGSVVSFLHCMNDPQPEGSRGKPHRTTEILSHAVRRPCDRLRRDARRQGDFSGIETTAHGPPLRNRLRLRLRDMTNENTRPNAVACNRVHVAGALLCDVAGARTRLRLQPVDRRLHAEIFAIIAQRIIDRRHRATVASDLSA
jgi:hypothetical protein